MEITALDIFEESRFIIELALAIIPIIFCLYPKKKNFLVRFLPSMALIYLIAISYCGFSDFVITNADFSAIVLFQISWYLFLTGLIFAQCLLCFDIPINDCLLLILGGYAIQHIDFVVINEIVRFIVYPEIASKIWLYTICSLGFTLLLYPPYSYLIIRFAKGHSPILDSKKSNSFFLALMLVILLASSFFYQNYFRRYGSGEIQIVSSGGDIITSFVIVVAVMLIEKSSLDKKDKELLSVLYEKEKEQYDVFKGSVEYINVKFHDLKHEMKGLMNEGKISNESYEEIKKKLAAYEANIDTGNPDLDIILSDVALKCLNKNISFSPLVDGKLLSKIERYDLYVLFSNIFDNAITHSEKEDVEHRYISLVVKEIGDMIVIKETNYLGDASQVQFNKDGSIKTTKPFKNDHGYGTKSIIRFAKQYKGNARFSVNGTEFTLLVTLPK